jgi:ATP-dependent DNA helicase DinG
VRHEAGRGFLPKFARVVIDEAHHLEDAGTSVATERLSRAAVERSTWSVLDARARKGALRKVLELGEGRDSPLTAASRKGFLEKVATAEAALSTLRGGAGFSLGALADTFLPTDEPVRVVAATEDAEPWRLEVTPTLLHLASELESSAEALDHVLGAFDDAALAPAHEEPLMVLKRAHRRLSAHATFARSFLEGQDDCRWVEPDRDRRGERAAAACRAPIEVGPVLKRLLWDELPGTALTSATMTVAGRFDHLVQRVGVPREDHTEIVYDSPFDHASQALLALPRDLPSPDDPAFPRGDRARGGRRGHVVRRRRVRVVHLARGRPPVRGGPARRPLLAPGAGPGRGRPPHPPRAVPATTGAPCWSAPTRSGRACRSRARACGW